MSLTKRQKRRLSEISKMIESSIAVKDDMEEIQHDYVQEIDSVIGQFSKNKVTNATPNNDNELDVKPTSSSRTLKNVQRARDRRQHQKNINKAIERTIKGQNYVLQNYLCIF